jgi:tetratricopeptide (TPR) repeat protein
MKKWNPFPNRQDAFDCTGATLKKRWPRLHRGDCEPFPDAEALREAWRAFHRGDFHRAWEAGRALGPAGHAPACKSAATYATYLERDGRRAAALLNEAAGLCEKACVALPEHANSHYLLAYCLGRYAQKISVTRALADGLAGRVKTALEHALELEPRHAEAHVASGTYHAEVIGKVGRLLGGLTYGASESEALAHYRKALKLHPDSAIVRLEYARGLLLMDDSRTAEARKLLAQAAALEPADAAESLDIEHAQARLEKLEA